MLTRLESPPRSGDPLLWTDYVEVLALNHPDKCFSRGDLISLERRLRDTEGTAFDAATRWADIRSFAQFRQVSFGASYPFAVSADADTIELLPNRDQSQNLYIALLLCGSLRHVNQALWPVLTRAFEEISLVVFSDLMPTGSEVRATWAHGGADAPYTGTLFEKMQLIAADIRCAPNFSDGDFHASDTGDGGIDLISWHPMSDNREGIPIAFAQCGCSREDWTFKQLEASWFKHNRSLPVMHPWTCFYFMPLDMKSVSGDWAHKSDIGPAVIVDRQRLLGLVTQYGSHARLPDLAFVARATGSV